MPISNLTTEEISQLLMVFDNSALLSGLQKIWESERDFWRDKGDEEALNGNPSTARLIEYAARAASANSNVQVIRQALGL